MALRLWCNIVCRRRGTRQSKASKDTSAKVFFMMNSGWVGCSAAVYVNAAISQGSGAFSTDARLQQEACATIGATLN